MTNQWNHKNVVDDIKNYINTQSDLSLQPSGSLPIGSKRNNRLTDVDIIVSKNNNISHIIEVETKTRGTMIAGKLILVDEAIKIMIDNNSQTDDVKPKIIYLYKPDSVECERVKVIVPNMFHNLNYIETPIIELFTQNWHNYL